MIDFIESTIARLLIVSMIVSPILVVYHFTTYLIRLL